MDVNNHLNHIQHKGMALMLANIIRDTEQFKRVNINKWL